MKSLLALTILLAGTSSAFAQSVALQYKDLDLSSAAGKAELERRIEQVTRQICRADAPTGTRIIDRNEYEQCEGEVRAQISARLPR